MVETLYREVLAAIAQAEADERVHVILLTGEGRTFCVGTDLKEHGAGKCSLFAQREYLLLGNAVCRAIQDASKPVIAAVNDFAAGAGAEMAISADFLLMKENALLWLPEVSIGTFVVGGVSGILPRLVGFAKARELIMTGRRISGHEAEAMGLATRCIAEESFAEDVNSFAENLAKTPLSLCFAKEHLNDPGRRSSTASAASLRTAL